MKNTTIFSCIQTALRLLLLFLAPFMWPGELHAQNTYSLTTASCQSACGVQDPVGDWIGFMCYNLGAEHRTDLDPFSYNNGAINGDLYQWGRPKDGHQLRTSTTTTTRSATDAPGHNMFIVSNNIDLVNDWRSSYNNNLWGGTKTANDPCPSGYKVPGRSHWTVLNATTTKTWTGDGYRFGTSLYLPAAGFRNQGGTLVNAVLPFSTGYYYSSTVNGVFVYYEHLHATIGTRDVSNGYRVYGMSVRCVAE